MISELAARCFAARNAAHIRHWRTKSYAEHVALAGFYDAVIEAIDAIVEAYQGMYSVRIGDVGRSPHETGSGVRDDIVSYLTDEQDWIESHTDEICQGSASLGNLVQNLVNVYSRTVFMLGMK